MTGRHLVLLAVALLLAGCGLSDDREPRVITADDAPIDLDPAADDAPASGGNAEVTLYFAREGRLVSIERAADAETLNTAIQALLDGPTEREEALQLRTVITPETVLRGVTVDNEVGIINLGCTPDAAVPAACGLLGVGGTDQLTLFGQLVCTADAVPGIAAVLFQQEGQTQQAQRDGPLTTEPVRCVDYRSLGPDRS